MTNSPNRVRKGVTEGGQFAPDTHSEPSVSLNGAAAPTYAGLLAGRDAVNARLMRLQEQELELNRANQIHSIRLAAAQLLEQYPTATTLRVVENVDGENQYDPQSVTDAAGDTLLHVDHGDEWIFETGAENGPYLQELCWALDKQDDTWAEGIATDRSDRYNGKVFDIDLRAALNRPDPKLAEGAADRVLTEDEQETLVAAAEDGRYHLRDLLEERAGVYESEGYEEADLSRIRDRLAKLDAILDD